MNQKISYIRCLIHFGKVDHAFHSKEKNFIRKVSHRLGLDDATIEKELTREHIKKPELPEDQLQRYSLLNDLLHLMTDDRMVHEKEVEMFKAIAIEFGFEEELIEVMMENIKKHTLHTHPGNKIQHLISKELDTILSKNYSYEIYYK